MSLAARIFSGTMFVVLLARGGEPSSDASTRFDGEWDTILSCPNSNGALGYSFEFPSIINGGRLHGQKGVKGEPGWLSLDGQIPTDGHASLYADGLVGAAEAAVGHRPAGTQYGYHVQADFDEKSGRGQRVEGRPCTVAFTRKRADHALTSQGAAVYALSVVPNPSV